jgi:hypothetical protein
LALLAALVVLGVNILVNTSRAEVAVSAIPTATEVAEAVNGPAEFYRPSYMEYVAKTDSYVCGGKVTFTEWLDANGEVVFRYTDGGLEKGDFDVPSVESTRFGFVTDDDLSFVVSADGQLFTEPGEDLGLELRGISVDSKDYDLVEIIWGGR